jgi:hypothetical protein
VHLGDEVLDYDPALLDVKQVDVVESFTGQRFSVFSDADLSTSEAKNLIVLVWLCRQQAGETDLKIGDVNFPWLSTWIEIVEDPTDQPVDGDEPVPTVPATEESLAGSVTG